MDNKLININAYPDRCDSSSNGFDCFRTWVVDNSKQIFIKCQQVIDTYYFHTGGSFLVLL